MAAVAKCYNVLTDLVDTANGKLIHFACLKKAFAKWVDQINKDTKHSLHGQLKWTPFQIDRATYNLNVMQRSLANLFRSHRPAPKGYEKLAAVMNKFTITRHESIRWTASMSKSQRSTLVESEIVIQSSQEPDGDHEKEKTEIND